MLRKIATIGHPILRETARELTVDELLGAKTQALIDDMIETMTDANGAGIAAPQVFESVAICVMHVQNNPRYPYKPPIPLTVLVNPRIRSLTEEVFLNFEGCLSVPNLRGEVARSVHIQVDALDRFGKPVSYEVKGLTAGTYQHEVDHLCGRLFVDSVRDPRSLCTWEAFERYRREAFVERAKALVARFGQ
jgi:peptide deformylase